VTDRDRMRSLLPAIEPDRRIDDWGRSERVEGVFDATLVEFFYRYWFRCEVEGVENVPAEGGSLLVSNHAGALPPDAAMIGKAIRDEHPHPRPLYMTVEHFFKGYPGFSALLPKIGCVPAHPANVHRLLYDEGRLVLVFPEGRKGTEKLVRTATRSSGSAAEASSRRRCAPRPSWSRSASSGPRRQRRSSPARGCFRRRPG
jgi:1-acyl-sn-glycerol-3-phosphate acyltransferase